MKGTENLITVLEYSRQYVSPKGKPVTQGYIYKLIHLKRLKAVNIAGVYFVNKHEKVKEN